MTVRLDGARATTTVRLDGARATTTVRLDGARATTSAAAGSGSGSARFVALFPNHWAPVGPVQAALATAEQIRRN